MNALPPEYNPGYDPRYNPNQSSAVRTVIVHHPPGTRLADGSGTIGSMTKRKKRYLWAWMLGIGVVASTVFFIAIVRKKALTANESSSVGAPPTNAPTIVGDSECLKKRIRITEICNISGLDDELVEMKVLVNDQPYWPKQVQSDCMDAYGSDGQTCVVPESTLADCFSLKNSVELQFGVDGAPVTEQIKVTIVDDDFFWDDIVEIFVQKEDWYSPNKCEKKEIEISQDSSSWSARIKVMVDFGEVKNTCGVEEEALVSGLNDAAVALENVQKGLAEYVKGVEEPTLRRKLIFPLLASGFRLMAGAVSTGGRSFVKLFTRQTRLSNALSTTADMTEIGSFLLSILGDDRDSSTILNNNGVLLDKIFDRFDQIDSQLDSIQLQIQGGFEEMKLVVEQEFAEHEFDKWINFRLGVMLHGDYKGFMDRTHTKQSRADYATKFRATCNGDFSPYNIFQVLYSYSCLGCQQFSGKAHQYFLDTYVNLANQKFETPMDRVIWFRKSFGTVIIGAMTESVYLYSVCLNRKEDECEIIDPVWDARLEEMGDALNEVVNSLGEAESRLE